MRKSYTQMHLADTYDDVCSTLEDDKPKFIRLIEEHIDFSKLISYEFTMVFYRLYGRPRKYGLESFIRFFTLQRILGIACDKTMLSILHCSRELLDFCGFEKYRTPLC